MEASQQRVKTDVYAGITNRIIEQLIKGIIPWRKPWSEGVIPQNLITRRPYRGINIWLLSGMGYDQNYFLTFEQLKQIGGYVKKGQRAIPVVFWKAKDYIDEESGEEKKIYCLSYFMVFNVAQCTGINKTYIPEAGVREFEPSVQAEKIIREMSRQPIILPEDRLAFYDPLRDVVNVPQQVNYESSGYYYEAFFHELVHSTGHFSRLQRKEMMEMAEFGASPCSMEELIAEMGACYLMNLCGFGERDITPADAYRKAWVGRLREDKKFVIIAATKAQQAVDYILGPSAS